jgi:hypothetical protein
MADFELIDTKRFLKSPNSPSKTSKTNSSVTDEKTITQRLALGYNPEPAKPPTNFSGGVLLGENLNQNATEKISNPVSDAKNGFAGFAGPFGGSENKKGVKLEGRGNTIPRLPFALERLVSAASSDQLTGFSFDGVLDINSYVRAWACAYLVGDQQHALDRLNQVQTARELSR